jgi:hypothetical protein
MPRYSKNKQKVGDKGIQTTKSKTTSTKHKTKVKYSKSNEKIKSVDKADGSKKQVIKNNPDYGGKKTVSKTSASGKRSFKVKGKSPNEMKSPMYMKDLSGDGKITMKDVLIGRGVIDADTKYNPVSDREKDSMKKGDKSAMTMKSPMEMKKSPYTMYGKEMSPAQMKGKSPLAKYGCSKRL